MSQYQQQQKRNQIILAKEELDAARANKSTAGGRFKKAESTYYSVSNKHSEYGRLLKKRHLAQALDITDEWVTIFNDYKEDIKDLITYYKSQFSFVPHLKDMNHIYKEKNTNLYVDLKKAVNDSNVAIRLSNYYNNTSEYQSFINYYLKTLYWIAFATLILLFIFLGGWRNIKTWGFIIILTLFPLILINPLIGFVFSKMEHVAIDYFYLGVSVLVIFVFSVLSYFNNLALSTFNNPE